MFGKYIAEIEAVDGKRPHSGDPPNGSGFFILKVVLTNSTMILLNSSPCSIILIIIICNLLLLKLAPFPLHNNLNTFVITEEVKQTLNTL